MLKNENIGLGIIGSINVDTGIKSNIDNTETEFEMGIDIAADAAQVNEDAEKIAKMRKVEQLAVERLHKVQFTIEGRRNGVGPEYYTERTEEADEKRKADKAAIKTELQAAQDEVDSIKTQIHSVKLSVLSKDNKASYSVPSKFEYVCEVEDTAIVARDRSEYVHMFKANMRRTALAILDMCRVVYEAERVLEVGHFDEFCRQINYKSNSSTIRKLSTIGKLHSRLVQYAEQLPAAWTSIYALTQIPADDFERCIKDGYALHKLTGSDIDALVKKTRAINNSVSPFKMDKKTYQFPVATVFFTKRIDDTDFRLLQKAFDEIASRLPVKLVVKKEATVYFAKRREKRYEALKVEDKDVMVKPEKWDYGFAANSVNDDIEQNMAA